MKITKLPIATKLTLVFGIAILLLFVVSTLSVINLNRAQALNNDVLELQELGEAADELTIALQGARLGLGDYIISGGEEEEKEEIMEAHEEVEEQAVVLQGGLSITEIAGPIESVLTAHEELDVLLDEEITAYEANPDDITSALAGLLELDEYNDSIMEPAIDGLDEPLDDLVEETGEFVRDTVKNMLVMSIVLSLIVLLLSAGAGYYIYYISSGIVGAAIHLNEAADSISRGNLDVLIDVKTGDEMEDLAGAIDRMRASLKLAVSRLQTKGASRK